MAPDICILGRGVTVVRVARRVSSLRAPLRPPRHTPPTSSSERVKPFVWRIGRVEDHRTTAYPTICDFPVRRVDIAVR